MLDQVAQNIANKEQSDQAYRAHCAKITTFHQTTALIRSIIERKELWEQEEKFVRPSLDNHTCDLCTSVFQHNNPIRCNKLGEPDPEGSILCPACEDTVLEKRAGRGEVSPCQLKG